MHCRDIWSTKLQDYQCSTWSYPRVQPS